MRAHAIINRVGVYANYQLPVAFKEENHFLKNVYKKAPRCPAASYPSQGLRHACTGTVGQLQFILG